MMMEHLTSQSTTFKQLTHKILINPQPHLANVFAFSLSFFCRIAQELSLVFTINIEGNDGSTIWVMPVYPGGKIEIIIEQES